MSNDSYVRNLIFDFGGVIMNINPMAYAEELMDLGCPDLPGLHASFIRDEVYRKFETGKLSSAEFRERVRQGLPEHASDQQIDHAWNLILGEIPVQRFQRLLLLGSKYRTFLLSNTNPIHYDFYQEYARKTFGLHSLDSLFEKAYYSFQIGLYKPDREIFEYVVNDSGLDPAETAFIDDMKENVEAARSFGLHGIHVPPGTDFTDLMEAF